MLTVHTMMGNVEADVRNGSSQSRYHGNTTGANKRVAAMGQANAEAWITEGPELDGGNIVAFPP